MMVDKYEVQIKLKGLDWKTVDWIPVPNRDDEMGKLVAVQITKALRKDHPHNRFRLIYTSSQVEEIL